MFLQTMISVERPTAEEVLLFETNQIMLFLQMLILIDIVTAENSVDN